MMEDVECPDCEGRGLNWFGETCERCAGYGDLRLDEPLPPPPEVT